MNLFFLNQQPVPLLYRGTTQPPQQDTKHRLGPRQLKKLEPQTIAMSTPAHLTNFPCQRVSQNWLQPQSRLSGPLHSHSQSPWGLRVSLELLAALLVFWAFLASSIFSGSAVSFAVSSSDQYADTTLNTNALIMMKMVLVPRHPKPHGSGGSWLSATGCPEPSQWRRLPSSSSSGFKHQSARP